MVETITEAVRVVRGSSLLNETNTVLTLVKGEWDEAVDVVKRVTETVSRVSPYTSLVIRADIRNGYTGQLQVKIDTIGNTPKITDQSLVRFGHVGSTQVSTQAL